MDLRKEQRRTDGGIPRLLSELKSMLKTERESGRGRPLDLFTAPGMESAFTPRGKIFVSSTFQHKIFYPTRITKTIQVQFQRILQSQMSSNSSRKHLAEV